VDITPGSVAEERGSGVADGAATAHPGYVAGRQRYVVGIFVAPLDADGAVARLTTGGCDILVVSNGSAPPSTLRAGGSNGHVVFHQIDTSAMLGSSLAAVLGEKGAFASLGGPQSPARMPWPGMQRLFQNLVHHLTAGAAAVVVHAPSAEQQLRVSQALLAARCDILLTHDVLPAAGRAPDAAGSGTEDCCGS